MMEKVADTSTESQIRITQKQIERLDRMAKSVAQSMQHLTEQHAALKAAQR